MKLLQVLIVLYAIPTGFFALYYNYQYAVTEGFVKWLFFGEIIATIKSLFWPYFVFFS
jgi:hypothetical protein